jgi:hypothetical protein
MVAFSCCVFDGGDEEKKELDVARERGWRGKFTRPGRVIRPGAIRMNGKCPLTPLEVCLYQILELLTDDIETLTSLFLKHILVVHDLLSEDLDDLHVYAT